MRQLRRRHEPPLGPEDLVVRAGVLQRDLIAKRTTRCMRDYGVYGFSAAAKHGATFEELIEMSEPLQTRDKFGVASLRALTECGITVYPTGSLPHYTLELPRALDDDLWSCLLGVFTQVERSVK